jgi:transglutaminase-like putative cysteine protease
MKPFLQSEINIQSDSREIMDMARRIAGKGKDPVSAARRLMFWLYKNVKKRPVVAVPSAMDVLKTRVGDCNEHAVLLTAFLRSLGIPARQCVGIVYVRGGFYYHAWTEAFLGEWVSMDPTLNQMPVDATHIKFIEGGLDRQVEIIALIGKVKLEVSDYGYD